MKAALTKETWVWVVIQNPGGEETIVGQRDEEKEINFIPFFRGKDAAQQCLAHMTLERGTRYEPQAIFYDELARYAADNGFILFLLDTDGKILEMINPHEALKRMTEGG